MATVEVSNAGLETAIKDAGGKIIRTAVGDKNVIDEMLKRDFNFGGEQSGHLIFRDFSTTGERVGGGATKSCASCGNERRLSPSSRNAGRGSRN